MSFGFTNKGPSIVTKILKDVMYRVIIITRTFCCVPLDHITSFAKKPKSRTNVSDRITSVMSKYKFGDCKHRPTVNYTKEQLNTTSKNRPSTRYLIYLPKRQKKVNKCFQIDAPSIDKHDKNFKMWSIRELSTFKKQEAKELTNLIIDKSFITQDGKVIVKLKKKPFCLKRLFSSKPKLIV